MPQTLCNIIPGPMPGLLVAPITASSLTATAAPSHEESISPRVQELSTNISISSETVSKESVTIIDTSPTARKRRLHETIFVRVGVGKGYGFEEYLVWLARRAAMETYPGDRPMFNRNKRKDWPRQEVKERKIFKRQRVCNPDCIGIHTTIDAMPAATVRRSERVASMRRKGGGEGGGEIPSQAIHIGQQQGRLKICQLKYITVHQLYGATSSEVKAGERKNDNGDSGERQRELVELEDGKDGGSIRAVGEEENGKREERITYLERLQRLWIWQRGQIRSPLGKRKILTPRCLAGAPIPEDQSAFSSMETTKENNAIQLQKPPEDINTEMLPNNGTWESSKDCTVAVADEYIINKIGKASGTSKTTTSGPPGTGHDQETSNACIKEVHGPHASVNSEVSSTDSTSAGGAHVGADTSTKAANEVDMDIYADLWENQPEDEAKGVKESTLEEKLIGNQTLEEAATYLRHEIEKKVKNVSGRGVKEITSARENLEAASCSFIEQTRDIPLTGNSNSREGGKQKKVQDDASKVANQNALEDLKQNVKATPSPIVEQSFQGPIMAGYNIAEVIPQTAIKVHIDVMASVTAIMEEAAATAAQKEEGGSNRQVNIAESSMQDINMSVEHHEQPPVLMHIDISQSLSPTLVNPTRQEEEMIDTDVADVKPEPAISDENSGLDQVTAGKMELSSQVAEMGEYDIYNREPVMVVPQGNLGWMLQQPTPTLLLQNPVEAEIDMDDAAPDYPFPVEEEQTTHYSHSLPIATVPSPFPFHPSFIAPIPSLHNSTSSQSPCTIDIYPTSGQEVEMAEDEDEPSIAVTTTDCPDGVQYVPASDKEIYNPQAPTGVVTILDDDDIWDMSLYDGPVPETPPEEREGREERALDTLHELWGWYNASLPLETVPSQAEEEKVAGGYTPRSVLIPDEETTEAQVERQQETLSLPTLGSLRMSPEEEREVNSLNELLAEAQTSGELAKLGRSGALSEGMRQREVESADVTELEAGMSRLRVKKKKGQGKMKFQM